MSDFFFKRLSVETEPLFLVLIPPWATRNPLPIDLSGLTALISDIFKAI